MGPFGVNGEEGRGYTHIVTATDYVEASEVVRRQDMGYCRGGSRTRGRGNTVNEDLHRDMAGNYSSVGGSTSLI